MIIFKDKTWQSDTSAPEGNYLDGTDCEQPRWILSDDSQLARRIMAMANWEPVEDEWGALVDVIPVKETAQDKIAALKLRLCEADRQSIRSLRAYATGEDTQEDRARLKELEKEAAKIRSQLAVIEQAEG